MSTVDLSKRAHAADHAPGAAADLSGSYGAFAADNEWSAANSNTHRGPVYIRADDLPLPNTNGVIQKPLGDGTVAPWWLVHDDTDGYLIHMGPGPNFGSGYAGGGLALIGMGTQATNQNGTGILIDNRGTGGANGPGTTGLIVTNFPTTTLNAVALLQQGTAGRGNTLLQLEQLAAGGSPLLGFAMPTGATTSPGQQHLYSIDGGGLGDAGEIRADVGELNWFRTITAYGSRLVARDRVGSADITAAELQARPGYRPTFRDGQTTAGSTTLTSASAAFGAADVGRTVFGGGIPIGTTIVSVTDASHAVMSQPATLTNAGVAFTVDRAGQAVPSAILRLIADSGDNINSWVTALVGLQHSSGFALQGNTVAAPPGSAVLNKTYMTGVMVAGAPRISFYGAPVTAQSARLGQLTDSSGGTSGSTILAPQAAYSASDEARFRATMALMINGIESMLHNIGISA